MKKQKYTWKIEDWAGNEIFGTRNGQNVELRFKTFDDAEEWLVLLLGDDYDKSRGEYLVFEVES